MNEHATVEAPSDEVPADLHLALLHQPMHPHLPQGLRDELLADIERLRLPELEPEKGWRKRARRRAKH